MFKSAPILIAILIVLLAASCAPVIPPSTPAPILTEEPVIPVTGPADVQSMEIQVLEGDPLQVNAILRGQLPNAGCTTISSVDQVREGNTFRLTVNTSTTNDPAVSCAQVLTPFEQIVALDVSSLPPGKYTVIANGIEQSFDLPARDAGLFSQALVDAIQARDFEKLKSLMEPTFTIAYWQSEGTSNTPEQAIEQLQRNLLSQSSQITADPNKNLAELLGMDPVTIVGPDALEIRPLFSSGWGPEGKDEAVLFIAKRSDGAYYWYGLLFGKDGFAKPAPSVATPTPVDTKAYATQVQYVLAQQDVNMRSGPGLQFKIINYIAAGQTAKVTGVSANGAWWRVICPDNTVGSCWVSAATNLTKPSNSPLPDQTSYPTNVKYVTALKDVNIYLGPGTQFSIVGLVKTGETAQVLGVNADKRWWQVPCLADEVKCWISADPKLTQPTGLSSLADVQSVEVQVLQSYPIVVNAIARGMLPDAGCTTIAGATQSRSGNSFTVTLTTKRDPLALCAQMLTPFEYTVPLDVSGLMAGRYNVNVNGVFVSFELPPPVSYP